MKDMIQIFVAQRNVNWHFLGVLQHENKESKTHEENNLAHIFPSLLFHQFISKLFASHSTLCHLSMTQRS